MSGPAIHHIVVNKVARNIAPQLNLNFREEIISGKFKGRRFNPPADNWPTRPTTDFAKEGLFNILNNNFDFEELAQADAKPLPLTPAAE